MPLDLLAALLMLELSATPPAPTAPEPPALSVALPAPVTAPKEERFFPDRSLKLIYRNYAGGQTIEGVLQRSAWIQSVQAYFDSGYSAGPVGVGFSVAPFAAIKFDSSDRPGNMVVEQGKTFSAFLGGYTLNARIGGTRLRYGLQRVSNPFLESKDNRSLPPTFRGLSLISDMSDRLSLDAGSFNAVQRRGDPKLQDMMSAYGAVRFDRLDYVGATLQYSPDARISVYSSRAKDVWRQHYLGGSSSVGQASAVKWTASADAYMTQQAGAAKQGAIDNKAFSVGLSGQHRASTVAVAYQRNVGDQWFDYVNDTWGDFLSNSSAEDYNTPHERSLQLRYEFDGAKAALPGVRFKTWAMAGWGSESGAGSRLYAAPDSLLHELYWRNGQPAGGSHHEVGFLAAYELQAVAIKGARISLLVTFNRNAPLYANASSREYNLKLEIPMKVF